MPRKTMRKADRKMLILAFLVGIAAVLVGLFAMRQARLQEYEKERYEDELFRRAHEDCAPPRDFRKWKEVYGAGEHDPTTPEGKSALDGERARLPEAKERLNQLLSDLPAVYASEDDAAESVFFTDFIRTLDGFGRASCAEMLTSIHWGCFGKNLENVVETLEPARAAVAVGRYYRVICKMVDLLWTRGGLEYEAAEADAWTYSSLRDCRHLAQRRKLAVVETAIDRSLENWKDVRCDSEDSNFCRAHQFWEERYRLYYEERVKRGEANWLKALSGYYRYQLKLARGILKREPRWSPDYRR